MSDLIDRVAEAIWEGRAQFGEPEREEAKAAIAAVIREQIEWSKTTGYNDWFRLAFRNFALMNEIEL